MTTQSQKTQFLLVFHQPREWPPHTPQELEQIFSRWMAWTKDMKDKGIFVGSNRLQDTGKVLRGPRGAAVTDGPYTESKEIVGGYILITAGSYAQALEVARGCPGLDGVIVVEVRQIEPMPEA